jgi:hypothetical protein
MARNEDSRLRGRRRPFRLTGGTDAEPLLTVPPPRTTSSPAEPSGPDDVTLVHGWLSRCGTTASEAEELSIVVLRRAREAGPACVAAASRLTRLQYLTVQAVLRQRGIV